MAHTTYYESAIVTIDLPCIVFELFEVEYRDLEPWVTHHGKSWIMVPFESFGTVSYSHSIITMALSCSIIFSQPSIYIDGWLYAMSMTFVVCNVPVLSQNDWTYHHSVFTT